MESRTILMLASVAIMLIVAGIGNAFASGAVFYYTSTGNLISQLDNAHPPSATLLNYASGHNYGVTSGDYVRWYDTYINFYSTPVAAASLATTDEGGLVNEPEWSGITSVAISQMASATSTYTVADSGSYTIYAQHVYWSPNDFVAPTPFEDQMFIN